MITDMHLKPGSLEEILVSGGDQRCDIDPRTGLNSFGCSPYPTPDVLSYGSSTASSISEYAFAQLEHECAHILEYDSNPASLDSAFEALRHDLLEILQLTGTGTEIVFSPSGTDSTLQALLLVKSAAQNKPLDCIMMASDETGSGVPNALSGRHFSNITSKGLPVYKGDSIAGLNSGIELYAIASRCGNGVYRSVQEIDQQLMETVAQSVSNGNHVLLQVMECSKLGSRSPNLETIAKIKHRFGNDVTVVIDACQMRLSRKRLKRYLSSGFIVLISGSKFFTGPPFSGALLIPRSMAHTFQKCRVIPGGLAAYTSRYDWPARWDALRSAFPIHANYGQLFRWRAAVLEMQRYFSIPLAFRREVLSNFSNMVESLIADRKSDISLFQTPLLPQLNRDSDIDDEEMSVQTIFPILIMRSNIVVSQQAAAEIYRLLNQNSVLPLGTSLSGRDIKSAHEICHVGQPVNLTAAGYGSTGVVRICSSARTVCDAWSRQNGNCFLNMDVEENELISILTKILMISRDMPSLAERAA